MPCQFELCNFDCNLIVKCSPNLLDSDNVRPTNPFQDLKLQLLDSLSALILTTLELSFIRISPSITARKQSALRQPRLDNDTAKENGSEEQNYLLSLRFSRVLDFLDISRRNVHLIDGGEEVAEWLEQSRHVPGN